MTEMAPGTKLQPGVVSMMPHFQPSIHQLIPQLVQFLLANMNSTYKDTGLIQTLPCSSEYVVSTLVQKVRTCIHYSSCSAVLVRRNGVQVNLCVADPIMHSHKSKSWRQTPSLEHSKTFFGFSSACVPHTPVDPGSGSNPS